MQQPIRCQRDAAFEPLKLDWLPVEAGGNNRTLNKMGEEQKIRLVDAMALPPANWYPGVTIRRAETKVSSDRSNYQKHHKQVCVRMCVCLS